MGAPGKQLGSPAPGQRPTTGRAEGCTRGRMMRIVVDLALCQGYAQCCFLAPDVFEFSGEEALMYVPEPDDDHRDQVVRAAKACPVQAILLDYADEPAVR
jgi:ferredoxin